MTLETFCQRLLNPPHPWKVNSKIEVIKRSACGFRNKNNFKTAILFHCGKLDMMPEFGA